MQTIMRRKLALFGHICRMKNDRKIKSVMMGTMEGTGKRGRPNREWLDDVKDWCQKDVHILSRWHKIEKYGKRRLNMHWTPTGFLPMDSDDDDRK